MKRRNFISTGLAACSGVLTTPLFSQDIARTAEKKLTILHTNDVHSHIDPFPIGHSKYGGKGGIEWRASIIDRVRREEKNVLLLDAGDIFQGTPYFNLYNGEVELKVMSALKYDAGTIGNHDFDNGLESFAGIRGLAHFPFLISNYDFSNTPMNGKTKEYEVFHFDGFKVGVFGIGVELKGLVLPELYGETVYEDPIKKMKKMSRILKKDHRCDVVVCLSHLGFSYKDKKVSDQDLAKESKYVDVIIGGHTHTFLEEPVWVKNAIQKPCVINQAGWAGIQLGRIDISLQIMNGKNDITGKNYYDINTLM